MLRFVLWPRMWSRLVTFHGCLKRMCNPALLGGGFYTFWLDPFCWWLVQFDSLLILCLIILIVERLVLKSPASKLIICLFFFSVLSIFASHIFSSIVWWGCIWDSYAFLVDLTIYHYVMSLSVSTDFLCSAVYVTWLI